MIKNYIHVFARLFVRQKAYSIINVIGLAIGLSSSIFIVMWVRDEISYDKFHSDIDRIYQVMDNQRYSDGITYTFEAVPGVMAEEVRAKVPEVEFVSQASWPNDMLVTVGEKSIKEQGFYAESDFFKIFDFKIIAGNRESVFPDKNSVAISKRLAEKYFGTENPLDKVILVENRMSLRVTALFEDVPDNSSVKFDMVLPYAIYFDENKWLSGWSSNGVKCYVKLQSSTGEQAVNDKIRLMAKNHYKEAAAEFWLQPYSRHRLYNVFKDGKEAGGRIEYIQIFIGVAGFIILIACINFMNLATARSIGRAKEVGVRKVAGAPRGALISQFLTEAFAMTVLALAFALLLVKLLLPLFNGLTTKNIQFQFSDPFWLLWLSIITIFTALLSGSYPALFLSSFKPVIVLKSNSISFNAGGLRKILVVFQFSLSVILIVSSLVLFHQMEFIRKKNLGLNKDNVLFFWTPSEAIKNQTAYKSELQSFSGIKSVGLANQNPLSFGSSTGIDYWPGKQETDDLLFSNSAVDEDFIETMGIELAEGRNFSGAPSDSSSIIFNEQAIHQMGLKSPVVGQKVKYGSRDYTIIGVVKNFHHQSIRNAMSPLFLVYGVEWGSTYIKVEPSQVQEAIRHAESIYKVYNPGYPFVHNFLDEFFEQQYTSDKIIGRLTLCFTTVAIIISLLGLYSLASFTAEKRIKELGIRKALGASISELVLMLCGSFSKLLLISLIIGCPIAYFLMTDFLERYAYHTTVSFDIFAVTVAATLVIGIGTILYQAIRAAKVNPSSSLRSE